MPINVVEVFGKFAVETADGVVLFDSKAEAESVAVLAVNEAEFSRRAAAYCESRGLNERNTAAKSRIIKDFMAFEAMVIED